MASYSIPRARLYLLRNNLHSRSISYNTRINHIFTDPDPAKTKFLISITKPDELIPLGGLPEVSEFSFKPIYPFTSIGSGRIHW